MAIDRFSLIDSFKTVRMYGVAPQFSFQTWTSGSSCGLLKHRRRRERLGVYRRACWAPVQGHSVSLPSCLMLRGPAQGADGGMTSPGGPFVPFFLDCWNLHTKAVWCSISTSEWTQHFWKALTRLNQRAISCQSTHTVLRTSYWESHRN